MKNQSLFLGMITFTAVLLHGTLMPSLALFGGRPNLLVALVAGFALHFGVAGGVFTGLGAGLLADILFTGVFGMTAIPLVVIGYVIGISAVHFFRDELLVTVVVGFSSVVVFEVLTVVLSRLAFGVWWGGAFVVTLLPTVLVNGALMPLFHMALHRILPHQKRGVI